MYNKHVRRTRVEEIMMLSGEVEESQGKKYGNGGEEDREMDGGFQFKTRQNRAREKKTRQER